MKGDGWYSFPPPKPGDRAARAVHFLSVLYTSRYRDAAGRSRAYFSSRMHTMTTEQSLIGQSLDDLEDAEAMAIFHYEVSGRNQPTRRFITYASNEAQALGQIAQAIQKEPGGASTDLDDIALVGTFSNPTVIQVKGDMSAA